MAEVIYTKEGRRAFEPTLLIGIGAKSMLYTLRETQLRYIPGNGPNGNSIHNGVYQGTATVTSVHLFNLSQNPEEAIRKAGEHAALMGVKLERVSVADLQGQLEAIKRATADELAERERVEAANQAEYAERLAIADAQYREVIAAGFFPFGRFTGEAFEDADRGYVHWMMSNRAQFEDGSLMRLIADRLVTDYAEMAPRSFDQTATLGNVKDRLTLDVEVVRVASFEGEYGRVCFVTMATPENVCILAKGSFSAEVGEKLKIKATVTKHDDYKGQAQTVVNRVKVV